MANLVEEMKDFNNSKSYAADVEFEVVNGKLKQKVDNPEKSAKYAELMSGFVRRQALAQRSKDAENKTSHKKTREEGLTK